MKKNSTQKSDAAVRNRSSRTQGNAQPQGAQDAAAAAAPRRNGQQRHENSRQDPAPRPAAAGPLDTTAAGALTIGIDIGDRGCRYCVLSASAKVLREGAVATERGALRALLEQFPPSLVALEAGTHSPWISRLVTELGHEAIVANPRHLKAISHSSRKSDRQDALTLARLARSDRELLHPVRHRSEEAQADLLLIRTRALLVKTRTALANGARGLTKSFGWRLRKCDVISLSCEDAQHLPENIRGQVQLVLETVEYLTDQIAECDRRIEELCRERYREETARLRQVPGVGPITALSFILTLEDPHRFRSSRDVGAYLGLQPSSHQSGDNDPEMRISKEGNRYLRSMAVQSAQWGLSGRAPDSDLKRWGLAIAAKGKKKAKRRAVVAMARKIVVLLHALWVSGETYRLFRNGPGQAAA